MSARKRDISSLEEKIISMYAKGMTTRDIQAHIKDLYNYEISPETVSSITEAEKCPDVVERLTALGEKARKELVGEEVRPPGRILE